MEEFLHAFDAPKIDGSLPPRQYGWRSLRITNGVGIPFGRRPEASHDIHEPLPA